MAVVRTLLALRFGGRSRLGLVALAAVAFVATVGVVAAAEVRSGTGGRLDTLFTDTGEPDLVVTGGPTGVPQAISEATDRGDVAAATTFDAAFASFVRPDGTAVGMGLVAVDDASAIEVGRPMLADGRWPEGPDELVLDTGAAVAHDRGVGSLVVVERNGLARELVVVGTAVDLTDCFYPTCLPLRGYVSSAGLAAISPDGTYSRANVALADGIDEATAAQALADSGLIGSVDRWSDTRNDLLLPGRLFSVFLAGFGAFVLVATMIVVASTAVGSVVSRRRELGLLKALGATPGELLTVTVLEQLIVGLVGVASGWVAGSILAPWLQLGLVDVLGRSSVSFDPATLGLAAVLVAAVLFVATIAPARSAGRTAARAALADAPGSRTGGLRSLLQRLPLRPPAQLGVQLALGRPLRAVLASLAIAVAVAAGLAGWRLSTAVDQVLDEPARAGDPYDVLVGAPPSTDEAAVVAVLAGIDGVDRWYEEVGGTGSYAGGDVSIRAIGPSVIDAGFVVADGRTPVEPDEALVGWGLLRDGTVAIGDTIEVQLPDGVLAVTVIGRHADLDNGGDVVAVSMVAYEAVAGPQAITTWRLVGDGSVDRSELARRTERAFGGAALVQPASAPAGQLGPFRLVLAALVALVAAVAAANLGATLVAGTRERRRELGVVRALGFSASDLRRQVGSGGAALGLVGVALGVPAGWIASQQVLDRAVDQLGLGPGVVDAPFAAPAVVAVVLGVVVAAAVAVLSTRQLRAVAPSSLVRDA